jgi:hypothetical protein
MNGRRVSGSVDWRAQAIVLDVPQSSDRLCYGFTMVGNMGEAWVDAVRLERVDGSIAVTNMPVVHPPPPVSAYKRVPDGLLLRETPAGAYQMGLDREGLFLHAVASNGQGAALWERRPADAWRGKRVRVSTRLKLEGQGRPVCLAEIWTDRALNHEEGAIANGKPDWVDCASVIDVPQTATTLRMAFGLHGQGTVRADVFKIEEVGNGVPAGPVYPDRPNLKFGD